MREVMTPEQVAQFLHVSKGTVYRLIRGGDLPASRVGRTYRIRGPELDNSLIRNAARPNIHDALVRSVLAIAERNPDVDGDQLVEELEAMDEERRQCLGV